MISPRNATESHVVELRGAERGGTLTAADCWFDRETERLDDCVQQLEIGRLLQSGRVMNPTINMVASPQMEVLAGITAAIRNVSAQAREVVITAHSLLLEELSLDSLDLVAVILELQDRFQVEIDPDEIASMRRVEDLAASLTKQLRAAA